jgi:hypothetical protein
MKEHKSATEVTTLTTHNKPNLDNLHLKNH